MSRHALSLSLVYFDITVCKNCSARRAVNVVFSVSVELYDVVVCDFKYVLKVGLGLWLKSLRG